MADSDDKDVFYKFFCYEWSIESISTTFNSIQSPPFPISEDNNTNLTLSINCTQKVLEVEIIIASNIDFAQDNCFELFIIDNLGETLKSEYGSLLQASEFLPEKCKKNGTGKEENSFKPSDAEQDKCFDILPNKVSNQSFIFEGLSTAASCKSNFKEDSNSENCERIANAYMLQSNFDTKNLDLKRGKNNSANMTNESIIMTNETKVLLAEEIDKFQYFDHQHPVVTNKNLESAKNLGKSKNSENIDEISAINNNLKNDKCPKTLSLNDQQRSSEKKIFSEKIIFRDADKFIVQNYISIRCNLALKTKRRQNLSFFFRNDSQLKQVKILSKDMDAIFKKSFSFNDVLSKATCKDFKVHKALLFCRCPSLFKGLKEQKLEKKEKMYDDSEKVRFCLEDIHLKENKIQKQKKFPFRHRINSTSLFHFKNLKHSSNTNDRFTGKIDLGSSEIKSDCHDYILEQDKIDAFEDIPENRDKFSGYIFGKVTGNSDELRSYTSEDKTENLFENVTEQRYEFSGYNSGDKAGDLAKNVSNDRGEFSYYISKNKTQDLVGKVIENRDESNDCSSEDKAEALNENVTVNRDEFSGYISEKDEVGDSDETLSVLDENFPVNRDEFNGYSAEDKEVNENDTVNRDEFCSYISEEDEMGDSIENVTGKSDEFCCYTTEDKNKDSVEKVIENRDEFSDCSTEDKKVLNENFPVNRDEFSGYISENDETLDSVENVTGKTDELCCYATEDKKEDLTENVTENRDEINSYTSEGKTEELFLKSDNNYVSDKMCEYGKFNFFTNLTKSIRTEIKTDEFERSTNSKNFREYEKFKIKHPDIISTDSNEERKYINGSENLEYKVIKTNKQEITETKNDLENKERENILFSFTNINAPSPESKIEKEYNSPLIQDQYEQKEHSNNFKEWVNSLRVGRYPKSLVESSFNCSSVDSLKDNNSLLCSLKSSSHDNTYENKKTRECESLESAINLKKLEVNLETKGKNSFSFNPRNENKKSNDLCSQDISLNLSSNVASNSYNFDSNNKGLYKLFFDSVTESSLTQGITDNDRASICSNSSLNKSKYASTEIVSKERKTNSHNLMNDYENPISSTSYSDAERFDQKCNFRLFTASKVSQKREKDRTINWICSNTSKDCDSDSTYEICPENVHSFYHRHNSLSSESILTSECSTEPKTSTNPFTAADNNNENLEHDVIEKSSCDSDENILPIEEIDPHVLFWILRYIYSGKLDLSNKFLFQFTCFRLYRYAKKIELKELAMLLAPLTMKARSKIKTERCSFSWTIDHLSKYVSISPVFRTYEQKMNLSILLSWENTDTMVIKILNFSFSLLDAELNLTLFIRQRNMIHTMEKNIQLHSSQKKISSPEIKFNLSEIDIGFDDINSITMHCDLILKHECLTEEIEVIYPDISRESNFMQLSRDLSSLLKSEMFTDVCLRIGNENFYAHRFILSSRSSTFAKMLKNSDEDVFDLENIDCPTLRSLLSFIYAGNVQDEEKNISLYKASMKYSLVDLQELCRSYILNQLSDVNVCEIAVEAQEMGDETLSLLTQDYMCKNASEIFLSTHGLNFLKNHHDIAKKLLKKLSLAYSTGRHQEIYFKF